MNLSNRFFCNFSPQVRRASAQEEVAHVFTRLGLERERRLFLLGGVDRKGEAAGAEAEWAVDGAAGGDRRGGGGGGSAVQAGGGLPGRPLRAHGAGQAADREGAQPGLQAARPVGLLQEGAPTGRLPRGHAAAAVEARLRRAGRRAEQHQRRHLHQEALRAPPARLRDPAAHPQEEGAQTQGAPPRPPFPTLHGQHQFVKIFTKICFLKNFLLRSLFIPTFGKAS